jgi:2-polyprenyl-6-methoxyphenol hydroxylase-like FAD-dependent oxidoreductase
MLIEPVLRRHAEQWPSIERRFGWRIEIIEETAAGVRAYAVDIVSGQTETFDGAYAVGCDGARSIVRDAIGARYEGVGSEDRDFMGGKMLATYLSAPDFYEFTPERRSWQYWAVNRRRFGALVAIDGKGRFVLHTQLPRGMPKSISYAKESIELTAGRTFDYDILGIAEWTAGFTLVSERYSSRRLFIAGDAAHLFTPTAGLGYNTSVDDVSNLGWKLAAVCQGWGGASLLASYDIERKPVAERNTRFARAIAEFFRSVKMPDELEVEGAKGSAARRQFGECLEQLGAREFDAPGIIFGAFYGGSPLICTEETETPLDDPNHYVPQAIPGARAPHVWLDTDVALYDRMGRDFTLLRLSTNRDTRALEHAAKLRGVPLAICDCASEEARDLYQADLVLVRPDQHIAWRANNMPQEPNEIIARLVGARGGPQSGV